MSTERHAAYNEALQRIHLAGKIGSGELSLANLALEVLPKELGNLTALTTLRVDGCRELKDISSLRLCTRLTVLDLRGCPQVTDLSPLRGLRALRELRLGERKSGDLEDYIASLVSRSALDDIDVITDLTALVTLTLGGCDRVRNFQPLATLTALQSLDLMGCG